MENDLHTVPGWVWTRTPPPAEAKLAPSVNWCAIGCKYGGSIGNSENWAAAIERKKCHNWSTQTNLHVIVRQYEVLLTNKIRDYTAIRESPSGLVEESFPIWPRKWSTFHTSIEVLVIAWIKEWVPKYKQGLLFSLWLGLNMAAAEWVIKKAHNHTEQVA